MSNDPATPLSIAVDSRLSDDVLLLQGISVKPGLPSQTAIAIDEQGNQFFFVILPDGGLVEMQFNAGLGSAVSVEAIVGGDDATEVVAFCDGMDDQGNLYVHVFWATPEGTKHAYRSSSVDWTGPELFQALSGLSISQRSPAGFFSMASAVSGIDNTGTLHLLLPGGRWLGLGPGYSAFQLGSRPIGDFAAVTIGTQPWVFGVHEDGSLQGYFLGNGQPFMGVATPIDTGGVQVSRLLGVQCLDWANLAGGVGAMLAFTDADGSVYVSVIDWLGHAHGTVTIAVGAGISSGSIRIWVEGGCRIYGTSSDGTLFVAQLTGQDANNLPIFTGLLPLDTNVAAATSSFPNLYTDSGAMSLLATRDDGLLDLMNQDVTTQLWTRLPVAQSGAEIPLQAERYRTRFEVTDANGMPCQGLALSVTPSSPIALEVDGQFVASTAEQPAALVTDATGTVEFSQPSNGLSSVTFSVAVAGMDAPTQVTPHGYLTALLAAQPGAEIYTGSAQIPLMSGQTLLNATVAGQPLAPALSDPTQYPDPTTAANSFSTWIQLMAAPPGTSGSAGFTLDLTTQGGPTLTQHATVEALQAHLDVLRGRLLGSIWSDIERIAGDIWHAVKHAAIEIAAVTIDAAKTVANLVVKIGEEFVTLPGLALVGIHEIASTVHGVLATIGADIDKVIDWLKDLFNWSHIWDTMDVFNGKVTSSLTQMQGCIPAAKTAASDFFLKLRTDIDAVFQQAIADLGASTITGSVSQTALRRARLLSGTSLPPPVKLAGSSAQRNWLMSKINTHLTASSHLPAYSNNNIPGLFETFYSALTATPVLADLKNAASDLQKFFALLVNPHDLWNTASADLLDALRSMIDVVLDIADAIIEAALALGAEIIAAVQEVLTTPLPDIPLISWLWDNVLRPSGKSDPLSLGSLLCLALAVPTTLIAEITTGSDPFSSTMQALRLGGPQQDALNILSWFLCYVDMTNDGVNGVADSKSAAAFICVSNIFDLLTNLVVQGLSEPGTDGAEIAWLPWAMCFLPLGVDAASCYYAFQKARGNEVPEEVDDIIPWADTFAGAAAIVAGLVVVSKAPTKQVSDWLSAILNPLPWATQFLMYPPILEASDRLSLVLQLVVDAVGDVGWLVYDPPSG